MSYIWSASRGRRIPVENLHDDHLVNILKNIDEGTIPRPVIMMWRALKEEAIGRGIAWKRWPKSSPDQWKDYTPRELAPSQMYIEDDRGFADPYVSEAGVRHKKVSHTQLSKLEEGSRFIFVQPHVRTYSGDMMPVCGQVWIKSSSRLSQFYTLATREGITYPFGGDEEVIGLVLAAKPYAAGMEILGVGLENNTAAVMLLQDKLFKARYLHDHPKMWQYGVYDEVTRNAVKCLQATYEVVQDGVVGVRTWATIGRYL